MIVHQDSTPFKSASTSPTYGNYYNEKKLTPSSSTCSPQNSLLYVASPSDRTNSIREKMASVVAADSATEYEDVLDDMSSYGYFRHPPSMVSAYAYGSSVSHH